MTNIEKIREHFADIWNCEIDHPIFQDRVSEIVEKTVEMVEQEHRWIPVSERLPENAHYPEIVCPTCRVMTPWGESQGWYNPCDDGWWVLLWFKYDDEKVPNFEEGSSPIVQFETEKGTMVTHWMSQSQPPKEGEQG